VNPRENQKRQANALAVIDFVLSNTLRLFHPLLPFITEELWHGLGYHQELPDSQGGDTIMFAHWPRPFDDAFKEHYSLDESDERFVTAKYDLVTQGRNLRREANIPSNKKVKFVFKPLSEPSPHDVAVLKILLNAEPFVIDPEFQAPKGTPAVRAELGEVFLPLEGRDIDAEKARLRKEIARIETEVEKAKQKLSNPAFVEKAPPAVMEDHKKRLADWTAKLQHVQAALSALEG
jgi:valyl-tRNA synthetase